MVRFLRHRRGAIIPAVITLLAVAACALVLPTWGFGSSEPVSGETKTALVTLPWGAGEGQVGLSSVKEGLTRGPEALAISPDGRIAVLDSVNRRLVLLDQQGRAAGKIDVALSQPRFLAVDDNTLYVLDSDADRKLAIYTWMGQRTAVVALPLLPDLVTGLFATAEGPCVEVAHNSTFVLGSTPGALVTAGTISLSSQSLRRLDGRPMDRNLRQVACTTYRPKDGAKIRTSRIERSSLRALSSDELKPPLAFDRSIDHLISVDGDGRGDVLVGARLLQPEIHDGAKCSLAITRLAAPGKDSTAVSTSASAAAPAATPVLLLADCDFAYLGQPYVVAPDGRVFQPVADSAGYTILIHTFAAAVQL